jgi:hypothetical protein
MRRFVSFFLLLGVLAYGAGSAAAKITSRPTPPDLLLGPVEEIPEIPAVKKILILTQPTSIERGKIQFLLARIQKTRMLFVRNGEMHPGTRAAMHLAHKYRKRVQHIKTVRQFIEEIASGSSLTGEPYYVKMKDGNTYRSREVFLNEIKALEEYLEKNHSILRNSVEAASEPKTVAV